jgi:hypothetical protein
MGIGAHGGHAVDRALPLPAEPKTVPPVSAPAP